jgi:hypothetical protein
VRIYSCWRVAAQGGKDSRFSRCRYIDILDRRPLVQPVGETHGHGRDRCWGAVCMAWWRGTPGTDMSSARVNQACNGRRNEFQKYFF